MAGAIDIILLERKAGTDAAKKLRSAFKSAIKSTVKSKGDSTKATVTSGFRSYRLDRLTFKAPYYVFMQHNGFEGTKKNGITMRLKATDVLNKALETSNVLETLADDIAEIRGNEILMKINLGNGR